MRGKYSQKTSTKHSKTFILNILQQMHLKLLQKEQFRITAETSGDLIGDKISNTITKISKKFTTK